MALVRLMSAGSHPEAQLVKGLLETEGIACVINAESGFTEMGTEAGFAEIFILVNAEQLEQAQQLVAAQAVTEAPEKPGVPAEGAVCPVHELQATGVCSRCGSHLCSACGRAGVPPVCEACDARLAEQPRSRTKVKAVAFVMLGIFLGVPVVIAVLLRLLYDR